MGKSTWAVSARPVPGTKDRLAAASKLRGGAPRAVFDYLLLRADSTGVAWPALSTIERDIGYSRRSIQGALRALEAALLIKGRKRHRRSTVWTVAPRARRGDLAGQRPTVRRDRARSTPSTRARHGLLSEGGRGAGRCARPPKGSFPKHPPTVSKMGAVFCAQNRTTNKEQIPEDAGATEAARSGISISNSWAQKQRPDARRGQGLGSVTEADLRDPHKLLQGLQRWRRLSTAEELRALAAASQALKDGRKPVALFVHLYAQRGTGISLAAEDAARRQLQDLNGLSPGPRKPLGRKRISSGCTVNVKAPPALSIGDILKEMKA